MKHIEKRFLLTEEAEQLDNSGTKYQSIKIGEGFDEKQLSPRRNQIAYLVTDKGKAIGGFVHKVQGKNFVFPLPDPTLVYFNNAQANYTQIPKHRDALLKKSDVTTKLTETAINEIYHFYGVTSGFVIFLFTSIESFINQQIPDDYVYENIMTKKTELYNKKQIQETLDFKTKITSVLTGATGKDYFKKASPTNQYIWVLEEFRDQIVHTKPDDNPLKYDKLIKTSLNFDYGKALNAVASFMNFYQTNYIVECPCGKDF